MRNITHLFFDLDHTLWDFKTNSRETLSDLFHEMRLEEHGVQKVEEFIEIYEKVNDEKWSLYRAGKIDKATLRATRFLDSLRKFDIEHPELSSRMEAEYIARSPHKTHLFPGALEVLETLAPKYEMHIITNGFTEVQNVKMEKSGLNGFFKSMITSEAVGVNKPDPKIFLSALHGTGAKRNQSVMIGDSLEADIRGARRVGMHQVFFNPEGQSHSDDVTREISELIQLLSFL